jgi:hypothetical protein
MYVCVCAELTPRIHAAVIVAKDAEHLGEFSLWWWRPILYGKLAPNSTPFLQVWWLRDGLACHPAEVGITNLKKQL